MPYDNSPLMHVIDLISPYMPASLSDPLYTLASLDFASLASNPSQVVPLALSLLAGYTAFLSFLSSARFAFRTAISLVKWGSIAAVLSAIYLGYNGAGTDRGVSGGVQDAAGYATGVGKTLYSLGRHGANWWFASNGQNPNAASSWLNSAFGGSGTSTARNRQARERRRRESTSSSSSSSRNARNSYRSNEDPSAGAQAAQDFVGQAFGSVLEFLNPPAAGNAAKNGKTGRTRRAAQQPAAAEAGGSSGFGWLSGMAQAKKAWDDMTAGGGAASGGRNRNR